MSRMWGSSRPYRKAPPRNSAKGLSNAGARDRARTGDPHVGKEMLGLISLSFFRLNRSYRCVLINSGGKAEWLNSIGPLSPPDSVFFDFGSAGPGAV
jgi:hypothetical protein